MRRGHAGRPPLQPQRLRGQPGPHRAGVPRGRPARRAVLRDLRPQRPAAGRWKAFAKTSASSSGRDARGDGLVGASFGLHASFTLTDRTLRRAVEANQSLRAGFHIHVAEDGCDAGAVEAFARARRSRREVPGRALRARHRGRDRDAGAAPGQRGPQPAIQLQQRGGRRQVAGTDPARRAGGAGFRRLFAAHVGRVQDRFPRARSCARATRAWRTPKLTPRRS